MKGYLRYSLIIFTLLYFTNTVRGQNRIADSLRLLLKTDKEDTSGVSHLQALAKQLSGKNRDTAIILGESALLLSKKIKWPIGAGISFHLIGGLYYLKGDLELAKSNYDKALFIWDSLEKGTLENKNAGYPIKTIRNHKSKSLGNIGNVYKDMGEYPKALSCFFKALELAVDVGNKGSIADNYLRIGLVYSSQAQYPNALKYYLKALKDYEEGTDKDKVALPLNNIGNLYAMQKNFSKALEYYAKTLVIDEKNNNRNNIARDLGNMGNVYLEKGDYQKSLDYSFKALKIDEEMGSKNGIAFRLNNIASTYYQLKDFKRAEEYFQKSFVLSQEIGDRNRVALNLGNIGTLYTRQKKYNKAEDYLKKAIAIAGEIGALNLVMQFESSISDVYILKNDFSAGLTHYKLYTHLKDSIFNENKNKELVRHELNYEFEKKEATRTAEQDKMDAVNLAEKKKQRFILTLVSCVLTLLAGFAVIIFRSLRIARIQKQIIEEKNKQTELQKAVIEEKNKDILDSIYYARRIQFSLLPSEKYIDKNLKKYFFNK